MADSSSEDERGDERDSTPDENATEASEEAVQDAADPPTTDSDEDEVGAEERSDVGTEEAKEEAENDEAAADPDNDASAEDDVADDDGSEEAPLADDSAAEEDAEEEDYGPGLVDDDIERPEQETPEYPAASPTAARWTGIGCMALMVLLAFGTLYGGRRVFQALTEVSNVEADTLPGQEVETEEERRVRRLEEAAARRNRALRQEARRNEPQEPPAPAFESEPATAWSGNYNDSHETSITQSRPMVVLFHAQNAEGSEALLEMANLDSTAESLVGFVRIQLDLTSGEGDGADLAERLEATDFPSIHFLGVDEQPLVEPLVGDCSPGQIRERAGEARERFAADLEDLRSLFLPENEGDGDDEEEASPSGTHLFPALEEEGESLGEPGEAPEPTEESSEAREESVPSRGFVTPGEEQTPSRAPNPHLFAPVEE